MMHNRFLEKIIAYKQNELQRHRQFLKAADLEHMIRGVEPPLPLDRALQKNGLAIIAEMKKASPSEGVIRQAFSPPDIARDYMQAGASALSVLTDERFFQGSIQHIRQIRNQVSVPILRKDFIIDPYQILEARAFGADAVLLIAAILSRDELTAFLQLARDLGMQALVEVHNEAELEQAKAAGARIIGINNRDLHTFRVDLAVTEKLAPLAGRDTLLVAESGIHSAADLRRMRDAGVHAVLIGTHFMRAEHPGEALKLLLEEFNRGSGEDMRHYAA